MSILTEADEVLLPAARRENKGFYLATKWYMDWEPLPRQFAFHQLTIPNVTYLGGIACGKTAGVAASYGTDCISTPYFIALNTSVTSVQAELPFEMFMSWAEANPKLEHLIEDVSLRPFPVIKFKNFSEWHFRTAGKNARFIRGSEYDRINYDEAGLDYDGQAMKILRGRLRGKRPDGITRMSRLDVTTSPTDSPWLAERFYRGVKGSQTAELDIYRSIRATTYENTHLTPLQIRLMEAEYTDEMIDVELRALFPKYGATTFPREAVEDCTSIDLTDLMTEAVRPEKGSPKHGWRTTEHPRHGIDYWEIPPVSGAQYVLAGDPGTGDPPKRNAPVIMVARTDVIPWDIVFFAWPPGKGSYKPFLSLFRYALELYSPVYRGLDVTGPQKALEELAFENEGIMVDGLNFNRDKEAMINSLIMAVNNRQFRWPMIKGLIKQMRYYRREEDRISSKQPQDIVMCLAELAFLARYLPEERDKEARAARGNYLDRRVRTRSRRRR